MHFGQDSRYLPGLFEYELVVAVTAGDGPDGATMSAVRDCLMPAVDAPDATQEDQILVDRLRRLSFPLVSGSAAPGRVAKARIDGSAAASPLPVPDGTTVVVNPTPGGWLVRLGTITAIEVGYGAWRESSPLGLPVVAAGAWQDDTFVCEIYAIPSAHRVRLVIDPVAGVSTARWSTVPLTSPDLALHLRGTTDDPSRRRIDDSPGLGVRSGIVDQVLAVVWSESSCSAPTWCRTEHRPTARQTSAMTSVVVSFKPNWVNGWWLRSFTDPYLELDGVVTQCSWWTPTGIDTTPGTHHLRTFVTPAPDSR